MQKKAWEEAEKECEERENRPPVKEHYDGREFMFISLALACRKKKEGKRRREIAYERRGAFMDYEKS